MEERNYSISTGMISAPIDHLDMDELVKKADAEIYLEKKTYYELKEHERRKHSTAFFND